MFQKLLKTLKLTLEFQQGNDKPFTIYVRHQKGWVGAYPFKSLNEAVEAYRIAWNVFSSVISYLSEHEKEVEA